MCLVCPRGYGRGHMCPKEAGRKEARHLLRSVVLSNRGRQPGCERTTGGTAERGVLYSIEIFFIFLDKEQNIYDILVSISNSYTSERYLTGSIFPMGFQRTLQLFRCVTI